MTPISGALIASAFNLAKPDTEYEIRFGRTQFSEPFFTIDIGHGLRRRPDQFTVLKGKSLRYSIPTVSNGIEYVVK